MMSSSKKPRGKARLFRFWMPANRTAHPVVKIASEMRWYRSVLKVKEPYTYSSSADRQSDTPIVSFVIFFSGSSISRVSWALIMFLFL